MEDAADDVAAAEQAAEAAEQAEEAYSQSLGRHNTSHTFVIGCLSLLGNLQQLANLLRYVLLHPDGAPASVGDFNSRMVAQIRLHPALQPGAPSFSPRDVPWDAVLSHTRAFVALIVVFRLPLHVLWLRRALQLRRAAAAPGPGLRFPYERTFFPLIMTDTAIYFIEDLAVLHATRAVVEWPALITLIHSAGVAIGFRVVPYRLRRLRVLLLLKAVASLGLVLLFGHWRVFVTNVGYAFTLLVVLSAAVAAPARDRAARERASAETAAAMEAAPQQGHKNKGQADK